MASSRALIVDISPLDQQDLTNAWAGRMVGIGNVIGYYAG
jgi:solute carrier family 45 protein 1/2/4